MTSRAFWTLAVLVVAPAARAADVEVTTIQAVHRHGQTFVTWKDVAEGEEGSKFRYSLYRSDQPITADNLDKAELCYHGVLNNSAKLFGFAFNMKDRLDPAKPYSIIEEGGKPLPPWSGLAVHTVQKPGKTYYAIVATDEKLKPVSAVVPGKSATTEAVEEKPGPIQPIKLHDSKERKTYVAQTSITGQKGLPLSVSLHGSQGTGGPAGEWGDYFLYFGTPAMGYRDGMPGVFTVQENRDKNGNSLLLRPRDAIEHPNGRGAFETMWLGYYCIPQGAKHSEPRVYPFTENRLMWMIDWSIQRYGADPQRISMGGSSMGGLGSINVGFRHPELFAAVYPSTAPFLWWPPWSLVGNQGRDTKALMADGRTLYTDYTNSPRFAAERHEDMPFLGWAVGRRDPNHNWQEYVDMVKALTANHHGFTFSWNDGGHSEGGRAMGPITKYYPASKFARNRSYPAFGNSSIDDKMGNGSKEDGAREGGINLGFDWKELFDEEGKWSITVSNDLAKEAMTVDVTPRRCQKFKLKPGAECKWTTATGESGTVAADQWGLVTVPKVVIKAGMGTVLTIQAEEKEPPLKVFVLAGTSNMLGAPARIDKLPDDLRQPLKDVLVYQKGEWAPLEGGKNLVGNEATFGQAMTKHLGEPIGIIWISVASVSGKTPGAGINNIVKQSGDQGRPIVIAGMLLDVSFFAGSKEENAKPYGENLTRWVEATRKEIGNDKLPIAMNRAIPPVPGTPYLELVRKTQDSLKLASFRVFDCDDVPRGGDKVHFNTEGRLEMGKRFGAAMIELMKADKERK